ncbi:hypothetical protein TraAM80_05928, partial [Trypanosoma rangeli]
MFRCIFFFGIRQSISSFRVAELPSGWNDPETVMRVRAGACLSVFFEVCDMFLTHTVVEKRSGFFFFEFCALYFPSHPHNSLLPPEEVSSAELRGKTKRNITVPKITMRERPRLTVRRGRGETPYLQGLLSRVSEPRMVSPHNNLHATTTSANTRSRSPNRQPVNTIQSYWARIAELAQETFRGLLHPLNGVPTTPNTGTTNEVRGTQSLLPPASPSVYERPANTTSLAPEASRQGCQLVDTNFTVPQRSGIVHETTFPDAPRVPLPSQSMTPSVESKPQIIYNFYYMNSGVPTSLPVAPFQMLQPEFTAQSSPALNRTSILASRPLSLKRERERQENANSLGHMTHTERLAASSVHPIINESSNTFPASNISCRTSLNTSYSGEMAAKRMATENYVTQQMGDKKYSDLRAKNTTEARSTGLRQPPTQNSTSPSTTFVRSGPPAVIPEDDGFAPNAESEDEDTKKPMPTAPTSSKPFSLGTASSLTKPAFGAGAVAVPAAPLNPFSFGSGSGGGGAAPADKPAAPSNPFSFGSGSGSGSGSGGAAPADKPAAPSNPFSFGSGSGSGG